MTIPSAIEVITLFVNDIAQSKEFYRQVFAAKIVYEDDVSSVMSFGSVMINLLAESEAPQLIEPALVAAPSSGSRVLLTVRIPNVDAACATLASLDALLNGPIDRPWGRRTAAFADPSGHVWEVAELVP